MLKRLLISPPLAIARLGSSDVPLECFHWGPNDDRPRGTGKTTIVPAETLRMGPDGSVTSYTPGAIQFKDDNKYRPVCPFFELHGEWESDGKTIAGPLTKDMLSGWGISLEELRWTVHAGNLKPFHMTQDSDCRIEAKIEFAGNDVTPKDLQGASPAGAEQPLIPHDKFISLGTVRLSRPTESFPELRLRFMPAKGKFYGTPDLIGKWEGVVVPEEQLFLNPESAWVGFAPSAEDGRTQPGFLFAGADLDGRSLGMVDDVCDAIIECSIPGSEIESGNARLTVSPPDYAPDRRHLISIADALKDHTDRREVWDSDYVASESTDAEIQDLFERIWETMGLMNVDVFNNRVDIQENPSTAFSRGIPYKSTDHYAFEPVPSVSGAGEEFPLTQRGRQFHRRMMSIEILQDMIREKPGLIEKWIREPGGNDGFFTKQMPPVMRDSSGGPLHLTRRQYDLLRNWALHLRKGIEENS